MLEPNLAAMIPAVAVPLDADSPVELAIIIGVVVIVGSWGIWRSLRDNGKK